MAEPWRQSRLFEDNFDGSLADGWDGATCTITSDTDYIVQGDGAAAFAADQYAYKWLNVEPVIWLRWYWLLPDVFTHSSDIVYIAGYVDGLTLWLLSIASDKQDDTIRYDGSYMVGAFKTPRPSGYQCVEVMLDRAGEQWAVYLDGNLATEGTFKLDSYMDPNIDAIYFGFGSPTADLSEPFYGPDTRVYVDALAIDRRRIGLLEAAPNSGAYVPEHDIELNGIGFNLVSGIAPLLEAQSSFNPRLGVGAPKYSDLSGFQHYVIPSQHNGIGQPEAADENMYLFGMNIDTTTEGMIRLANKIVDHNVNRTPPSSAYLADGFICAASNDEYALFGLAFGNEAPSDSYECLYVFDGTTSTAYSFTCTHGVQDILDNGAYVFVSLGGGTLQKSAAAGGLTFSEGTGGDSIVFDDGASHDSVTFTMTHTWSNAGSTIIPPTDMGQMAIYDEFVWVAERDVPWVHRSAQVDLSDLEGGNEDAGGDYDHYATRIGAGNVPITAMCPFLDHLYIGREDGLYRLDVDGEDIYVKLVEPVTRHRNNYRGMCVYNGFLVYQENGQVYQFNGTNKQNISPGPLSDTYPYERIQRWAGFWPHGKYLIGIGTPDADPVTKPTWYVMVNTQGPWHILGQLHDGGLAQTNCLPMPVVALESNGTAYMEVCSIADVDGYAHIHKQDMRHGASGAGATATSGYILSSTIDFGLPQIWRHLSLVREDVENILPGTNRVRVAAYYDNDATEHELGVIAADDCTFIEFPENTTARKIRFKHTLETGDEDNTPVLRRTILRYMDRPETVWGYQVTVELTNAWRSYNGEVTSYTPLQAIQMLKRWRDTVSPITFRDNSGQTSAVYITDLEVRLGESQGTEVSGTATIALLVVGENAYTPPPSGLTYDITLMT